MGSLTATLPRLSFQLTAYCLLAVFLAVLGTLRRWIDVAVGEEGIGPKQHCCSDKEPCLSFFFSTVLLQACGTLLHSCTADGSAGSSCLWGLLQLDQQEESSRCIACNTACGLRRLCSLPQAGMPGDAGQCAPVRAAAAAAGAALLFRGGEQGACQERLAPQCAAPTRHVLAHLPGALLLPSRASTAGMSRPKKKRFAHACLPIKIRDVSLDVTVVSASVGSNSGGQLLCASCGRVLVELSLGMTRGV